MVNALSLHYSKSRIVSWKAEAWQTRNRKPVIVCFVCVCCDHDDGINTVSLSHASVKRPSSCSVWTHDSVPQTVVIFFDVLCTKQGSAQIFQSLFCLFDMLRCLRILQITVTLVKWFNWFNWCHISYIKNTDVLPKNNMLYWYIYIYIHPYPEVNFISSLHTVKYWVQ